jgi:hypothetical protein
MEGYSESRRPRSETLIAEQVALDRMADDGGPDPALHPRSGVCRDCGAEVYQDGTHLLDQYDRASLGYWACTSL